jgi:hypothetical protein
MRKNKHKRSFTSVVTDMKYSIYSFEFYELKFGHDINVSRLFCSRIFPFVFSKSNVVPQVIKNEMTYVRNATLCSRIRTTRREEQTREMKIRRVPVTKYDVSRVHMPGGWLLVERVARRTGIPYVTLYDYPKRQPIRSA